MASKQTPAQHDLLELEPETEEDLRRRLAKDELFKQGRARREQKAMQAELRTQELAQLKQRLSLAASGAERETTITATEANRAFSGILQRVRTGESFVVTSHGEPVARIAPTGAANQKSKRSNEAFLEHLLSQEVIDTPRDWTRDDLYDDV